MKSTTTWESSGQQPWTASAGSSSALLKLRLQRLDRMLVEVRAGFTPEAEPDLERAADAYRSALRGPALKPPVDELLAGHDGTVWLRRALAHQEVARWMVLDERGVHLADVEVPYDWKLLAATEDFVYAATKDALDVPRLIKARILR